MGAPPGASIFVSFVGGAVRRWRGSHDGSRRSGSQVLCRPRYRYAKFARRAQGPVRIAQQFPRDKDKICLAGPNDMVRLRRVDNHSDRARWHPCCTTNLFGKGCLISWSDRDAGGRDVAAG